jgi:hypothetical protein
VLSETLLSVILLDSLPLADALSLFLAQRTKTLHDILSHVSHTKQITVRPGKRRDSRISTANAAREAVVERDNIGKVLIEAVQCLLETVSLAKAVFERKWKFTGEESMIEGMMKAVQEGEASAASVPAPMSRKGSHQRRASRLASMSFPIRQSSSNVHGPPVSTSLVLQSLPSSQILLRYLPGNITSFTPFITPSTAPVLGEKLKDWQTASIQLLSESTPAWLGGLNSVTEIWHVRATLKSLLGDDAFEVEIKQALEDEWNARVKQVWETKLDEMVDAAELHIRDAGEEVRNKGKEIGEVPLESS